MALMKVGGNFQLNTPAGLAYLRARSAGLPPGITTATRSYDLQMTWYRNQGKPGYPKWADHPDRSKHVYRPNDIKDQGGRALDLPAGGPREWMSKHGPAFGWFRRIKVEPWHFEYEEWNDPSRFQSPAPTPPTLEEDDMFEQQDRVTLQQIKTKMERLDPIFVYFRTTEGKPAVAVPRDFKWAIAPSEEIWNKHRMVMRWLGLVVDGYSVKEWDDVLSDNGITPTGDIVTSPETFGEQVAWGTVQA